MKTFEAEWKESYEMIRQHISDTMRKREDERKRLEDIEKEKLLLKEAEELATKQLIAEMKKDLSPPRRSTAETGTLTPSEVEKMLVGSETTKTVS